VKQLEVLVASGEEIVPERVEVFSWERNNLDFFPKC
jgi:hypothetical protein